MPDIPTDRILGAQETRALCGGISNRTLNRWREEAGFPAPIKELAATPLWDAAQVRQWLADTKDWRRRRRR